MLSVTGLFTLIMVASVVQGVPRFAPPDFVELPMPSRPTPTGEPAPPPALQEPPEQNAAAGILGSLLLIAAVLIGIVILILIVRLLVRLWRDRQPRRRDAVDVDVSLAGTAAESVDPDEQVVKRGIAHAAAAIQARERPDEAIVAAWLALEETAADAGAARGRSETPAEFTLRILRRRPGIEDATHTLLTLYERVRFGGHQADEAERTAAVAALSAIAEGWR